MKEFGSKFPKAFDVFPVEFLIFSAAVYAGWHQFNPESILPPMPGG
jgi:hypothetical protein